MGLRLGGIASGLDTEALIEAVMGLERRPLLLAKQRIAQLEAQKTLYGELGTKLTALREAAAAIDNLGSTFSGPSLEEELLAYTATSSNEDAVGATASGSATPGSVSLRVVSLAAAARRVSASFESDTTAIAAAGDTLDIGFSGGTISIVAPAAGASLVDLRAAINAHPNNDGSVRADVLFDGTGYRLVVRGTETGVASDVSLATTIGGPAGAAFLDGAAGQSAVDATLEVFGITATRASNTVADLLPGLTLQLRSTTAGVVDVSVALDAETVASRLEAFATAYNEVRDFIEEQSAYDEKTKKAGQLSGDGTLRAVQQRVQAIVVGSYSAGGLGGLTDIGVRFDDEGRLTVDREDLTAALGSDPNAVRQLLGGLGAQQGLAAKLAQAIDEIAKSNVQSFAPGTPENPSGSGPIFIELSLLPARTVAVDARIDVLERQIERLEARLAKREELLVAQFTRMESLVTQLREQGNSLAGIATLGRNQS
jgi:flagellar hook-associated protein 2